MSSGTEIGKISEKRGDIEVEWTIDDIFSYSKEDEIYHSPQFSVSGFKFYMKIYPYGETEDNSVGWIGLYLMRTEDSWSETSVKYNFGMKKADGTIKKLSTHINWVFDKINEGYGFPKCIERSELLRRKSELAPSNALTLTCSLSVGDGSDSAGGLDALSVDLKNIFLSERNCDVTLKVKNQAFQVHKSILVARSPVFAAMLGSDMKEKHTGIVDIVDCDPEPFEDFLMYIYSGKLESASINAFELYKIADKYQVEELKSACVGSMMDNLSLENVCDAIRLTHQFLEDALDIKTQDFFKANVSKILSTNDWELLLEENPRAANEFFKVLHPNCN